LEKGRSRKDAPYRDECRENGETSPGAGTCWAFWFPFRVSSSSTFRRAPFISSVLLYLSPRHEIRETLSSHKAFTTRIQLTRKASRNFTKRDSTLTLMLPVENCKNCLKDDGFFFSFYLITPYTKINLTQHTARSFSPFSRLLFSALSLGQASIGRVNLLRQNRETVSKPDYFIRK